MARYFGVSGDDSVGIKDGDGVLVTQLIDEKGEPGEDGPAYKAGVQPGDVIVKFDKREIETIHDLRSAVANTPPGEKQSVIVVRKGVIQNLSVVLAERTLEQQARSEGGGLSFEERREEERTKEIGLEFETLKQQDAEKMGLGDEQGVRILEVAVGSLADDAGLRAGQVITHVNGDPVQTAQDLYKGINSMSSNQGVILRIVWVNPQDSQRRKAIAYTSFIKP
jgi:serine protease Do